jgi:hypothetical protein
MVARPSSGQLRLRLRLAWAQPAMAPSPSCLPGHTWRLAPTRRSVSAVEREEGGSQSLDAVKMEDGGHRLGGRGGERRCETVMVDNAATTRTLLRVESDFGSVAAHAHVDRTPRCKHLDGSSVLQSNMARNTRKTATSNK